MQSEFGTPAVFRPRHAIQACTGFLNGTIGYAEASRWAISILEDPAIAIEERNEELLLEFLNDWAIDEHGYDITSESVETWAARLQFAGGDPSGR